MGQTPAMALPMSTQFRYWGLAAAVLIVVLWFLGDVILPFILGAAIAYCLDPVADRLVRMGLGRVAAVVLITAATILVFVVSALAIAPLLIEQALALAAAAPEMARNLETFIGERFPWIAQREGGSRNPLSQIGETINSRGGQLVESLLTSALSLLNILVLFLITPVVAFYLLLDWDGIVARIDALLPRDHAPAVRGLAREMDKTLASFIRGQGTVCLMLGAYYAAALMLVGLQFGLVVGFLAGALTFIPYVGAIVGGGLAIGLALFQFWGDWWWIALVWAIFQSGQFIEGNVLTPKLVGKSVGLHPVWLLFALSAFGALFGFVGLLVAVPVAAMIGVLVRFLVEQYRGGRLYRGLEGRDSGE